MVCMPFTWAVSGKISILKGNGSSWLYSPSPTRVWICCFDLSCRALRICFTTIPRIGIKTRLNWILEIEEPTYSYDIINASRNQYICILSLRVNIKLEIRFYKPHPLFNSTIDAFAYISIAIPRVLMDNLLSSAIFDITAH